MFYINLMFGGNTFLQHKLLEALCNNNKQAHVTSLMFVLLSTHVQELC